jgi:hypothetical protein
MPKKRVIIELGIALVVIISALLFLHLNRPRIVGKAIAPDGTEMMIVQKCNWDAEPFTTTFYFRKPNQNWGAFYFDHQDIYWGHSSYTLNTNAQCAIFYRGASPAITFWWKTETYKLHRWNRTLTGAQWQMPADWTPPRR